MGAELKQLIKQKETTENAFSLLSEIPMSGQLSNAMSWLNDELYRLDLEIEKMREREKK